MGVRAKMKCTIVEMSAMEPYPRYSYDKEGHMTEAGLVWPRRYRFTVDYGGSREDELYSLSTPSADLSILVDNPDVGFEVGKSYYLDFTKVDA